MLRSAGELLRTCSESSDDEQSTFRRSVLVLVAAASMTWLSGGVSIAHDDFGYGGGGTAASRMAAPVPDGADIEVPERSGIGGSERFRFTP